MAKGGIVPLTPPCGTDPPARVVFASPPRSILKHGWLLYLAREGGVDRKGALPGNPGEAPLPRSLPHEKPAPRSLPRPGPAGRGGAGGAHVRRLVHRLDPRGVGKPWDGPHGPGPIGLLPPPP